MRCARCGNDNPADNRFCGMCGATLLAAPVKPVPETQTQRAASSSPVFPSSVAPVEIRPKAEARPQDTAPRTAAPVSEEVPSISGPSFLGLNDPAPRKRASLSLDPHDSRGSTSVDYLLDDEEEPRRGGAGKFFVILLALALAVGFGYLRWKNQGFAFLHSGSNKPAAAAPNPDATDGNAPAPSSGGTPATQTPAPQTSAPASQPAPAPAQPAADSTAASPNNGANPSPGAAAPNTPAASGEANSDQPAKSADNSDDEEPAPAKDNTPAAPKKADKPRAAVEKPAPKPRAAVPAADPVAEAQKYLYGRGAAQDCDRGLRLLKPSANQANPKAMIEMGALYSAGLCTPKDLPTAYRWFALALRKDPENTAVQADLQKLWGEMTQPERQLAIKLTQ